MSDELLTDVERMMKQTLDQSGTAVYLLDSELCFMFFNELARGLMPDPKAVVVGGKMFELNPLLNGHAFGNAILEAAETRSATQIRAFSARLDGWYEMNCFPVEEGLAVYCRNITEEHDTEARLEQAGHRLQRKSALLDAASDAIYVRELDDTISYWNKGAERIYGWTTDEVLTKGAPGLLYADQSAFREGADAVMREGAWIGVLEQHTRDGRTIQVHCRWQLATDDEGSPLFVLCMGSDLTEFKREQDRTYRAQRLESLGTLAGGIAHDLNNVLTPVLIAVQLLQQEEQDEGQADLLRSIEASVTHGASMIRQVLSFARGEEGERSLVELDDLVEEVAEFARDTLPKSIRVHVRMASGLAPVMCDRTQILQILVNLVTNARDAMPDGGTLTIRACNRAIGAATGTDSEGGDSVVVEVEDTGSGMDESTESRVFEPFFSTKQHGSGTGLGLSTSLAIARGHGGSMEVYSEVGRGSRFQVRLPAASGAPRVLRDPRPVDEFVRNRGRGELVVVVDDDDAIRALTLKTLERNGYRTIQARDGLEAIQVIEEQLQVQAIDLVLTDMMMPVMDGPALIAYLHHHHPAVPVIAASGLTANVEVAKGARHSVRFFLPKPFSAAEMLQAIHRVFHEESRQEA